MDKIISPFDGKPRTKVIRLPDGTMGYIITPRVLFPLLAKAADILACLSTLWLGFAGVHLGVDIMHLQNGFVLLVVFAALWPVYLLLNFLWRHLLRKTTWIRMSIDRFSVRYCLGGGILIAPCPIHSRLSNTTSCAYSRASLNCKSSKVCPQRISVKRSSSTVSAHISFSTIPGNTTSY